MSAFGRDLIGNVNCGTANPLMALSAQMQGMGSQLADVRAFGAGEKGLAAGPLHPQQRAGVPMPMHPQAGQPMMQRPQQSMMPPGPGADAMAEQFMQMELQSKEFERAFQQQPPSAAVHHAVGPTPDMWANEFQQNQTQIMMPQQRNMMQQQNIMRAPPMMQPNYMMRTHAMGGMMGGMASYNMGMGMGMAGGMKMMPQQYSQFSAPAAAASAAAASASATAASSASATSASATTAAHVKEILAKHKEAAAASAGEIEDETDGLYDGLGDSNSLEEAYHIATGKDDWTQEYIPAHMQQAQPPMMGPGLAGGMDPAMLQKLMSSDNPKWRNSKFLAFINKISKGEIEFRDNMAIEKPAGSGVLSDATASASSGINGIDWADEFSIQQNHPASWSDQFAQQPNGVSSSSTAPLSQAEQWLADYEASGDADTEFKDFDWQQALQQAKEGLPMQKDPEYDFAKQNPFDASKDPFGEGVALFNQGRIKEAILAFEATVKQQDDHADAWAYLGEAQAQNEDENNAIAAFLKCIAIDPYNLKALLQLGVSYTNDLEESRALNYLKTWMENNPEYQGAALSKHKQELATYMQLYGSDSASASSATSMYTYDNTLHDEVTKMFLSALQIRPDDPDLHTVLGVMYHISSDFDKSIEAFKNALKLRPNDAALWNKLGATQANSSRSAEAMHAYQRALQLRPAYVRALANLAISYANQGMHEEAVRTYLTTLTHNADANHVWSYLRISLAHLGRDDLVELLNQRNVELFRPFFQF